MAWRLDSPTELPNGRLVCGNHGLVVCGRCCVDYSFMDEVLNDSDGVDSIDEPMHQAHDDHQAQIISYDSPQYSSKPVTRGAGKVIPTLFPASSSDTPQSLFTAGVSQRAT
ncbi:hypothetical protein ACLX1H_011012 [Fusarium chlamydosporum]